MLLAGDALHVWPAGARESTRARGVGKLAQIVPLGTADIGTADSAETHQAGLEWHRMLFMQKDGSWCDSSSLPRSGLIVLIAETTPGGFTMISPLVAAERRRTENGD